ncbi:MAG: hypothetical protein RR327_05790 [Clostridia bacterium]
MTKVYIKENGKKVTIEVSDEVAVVIAKTRRDIWKSDAKALAPQFNGTPEKDIENAVKSYLSIDAWMTNLAMTEDSFIRLQDIMANAGELKSRCEYTKLIQNKFANEVFEELKK